MATEVPDRTLDPELGPADVPGAPGAVPAPDHHIGVPAAPANNPPEPPVVPSEAAVFGFWSMYGPTILLVGVGLVIVAIVLLGVGNS